MDEKNNNGEEVATVKGGSTARENQISQRDIANMRLAVDHEINNNFIQNP